MCTTCGCEGDSAPKYSIPGQQHEHEHLHEHTHQHEHDGIIHEHTHQHHHSHPHTHDDGHSHGNNHHHTHDESHHHHPYADHNHTHSREIDIQQNVLSSNALLAERNRGFFEAKSIKAFNLVSSPGSGKTTLLEKTIELLKESKKIYVVEGDQQTLNDAERIQKTGVPVIQVNTGNGCHLDASMVNTAVKKLNVADNALLFIENVGNLVCPSMFDLGESKRVVIISVTEGDDKPLKYPNMFASSHLCIINKTDLLPHVDFSMEKAKENALKINHHLEFIEISAKSGEGMSKWIEWLNKQ